MSDMTDAETMISAAARLSVSIDADVILFNGPVHEAPRKKLVNLLDGRSTGRSTAFVAVTTYGGDPHEAYLMARSLQEKYAKIIYCVTGDCFSAGTLIVTSGEELVFGKRGHLGPLDIQVRKKDEFLEHSSGMVMATSLDELEHRVLACMNKLTEGI